MRRCCAGSPVVRGGCGWIPVVRREIRHLSTSAIGGGNSGAEAGRTQLAARAAGQMGRMMKGMMRRFGVRGSWRTGWGLGVLILAGPGWVFGERVFGDTRRPNIVFIYTDDQAPTAIGISGNADLRTPHMDRLCREGARLVNAFVTTPVCSPSRASLMTGCYASELGIDDWIHPRRESSLGLDPARVTWPELLLQSGYATGLVGKWHLGTEDRFHPTRSGFEYFMGFRTGGNRPRDPVLEIDGQNRKFSGFTADILTDHALGYLRDHRRGPFLLCLHYRAPHAAWLPVADVDWEPYKNLDPRIPNPDFPGLNVARIKKMTREYYASVASVDRNLGRLLDELKRLGLQDNTVVVFTSDHGYNLGHNGVWYKGNAQWQVTPLPPQRWPHIPPRQRPNLYDQSLRVPAAVRWPGVIRPGTVVEQTISNLDWYATLLDMAGVQRPDSVTVRGRSFLPLLRGESLDWDNALYAEYNMHHGAQTRMRAYRADGWKLMIDFANPGRVELYHLAADPAETTNLASSQRAEVRAVRRRFEQEIQRRMQQLGDQQPETPR